MGGGVDEQHAAAAFSGEEAAFSRRRSEMQQRLTRRDGSVMSLAQSKRASELEKSLNAWEENRLVTSGVMRVREVDLDFEEEEDRRVVLLVHDTKPPFLAGKRVASKAGDIVLPLKDPTSDMAVISRKGSALVKEVRRVWGGEKIVIYEKRREYPQQQRIPSAAGERTPCATAAPIDRPAIGTLAIGLRLEKLLWGVCRRLLQPAACRRL